MAEYTTLSVSPEVAAELRRRRDSGGEMTTTEVLEQLLTQTAER
jgi:hypothetical protein